MIPMISRYTPLPLMASQVLTISQCCTTAAVPTEPKTCKVGSDSGTCISTSSCKAQNKKSTPGQCPNDPDDIQCCTIAPAPNTCKVGDASGTCLPTGTCKASGKTSTSGKCPNDPDDVQCCTTTPAPNTCKVGNLSGTCLSTSSCKSQGKTSTPGKCPNDPDDVQCCTTPPAPDTKPPPPDTGDTCKIADGTSGECISTSSCSSNGGKSTAGFCPGATNIQVCFRLQSSAFSFPPCRVCIPSRENLHFKA